MSGHARQQERASALIAAIIMVVIVAALVGSITMMTSRSTERSNDASRRVSNDATIQTAVTRTIYAFQNDLGSESDFYVLDLADLREVTRLSGSGASAVATLPGLPAELARVDSVWEHVVGARGHRLVRVPPAEARLDAAIVREPIRIDRAACMGAGLSAAVCSGNGVAAYWQVYRVVMPDNTGSEPPNVVVYLRSFLGVESAQTYSRASYARVELRPGRFADYQQISDGNVRIGANATINGPVHSNGLADGSFSTVQEAPVADSRWIYVEPGAQCVGDASLSINAGTIVPQGCRSLGQTGQTISFLRAIDAIETIRTAITRGVRDVASYRAGSRRGAEAVAEPYNTAWQVVLNGRSMSVSYPDGSGAGTRALGRVNAFVFDEDVRVRGSVAPDVRVTIAAERSGGASASIFVDGNLVKGDDRTSAIGLISQGDIVLYMDYRAGNYCPATTVQAAMVAATGGLTIPTRYTTNELQVDSPTCGGVVVDGSVAGHRPPTLVWAWTMSTGGTKTTGYAGRRDYRWDQELKSNPPPYFPLTGTWQPFQVREANTDCLFGPGIDDPGCR